MTMRVAASHWRALAASQRNKLPLQVWASHCVSRRHLQTNSKGPLGTSTTARKEASSLEQSSPLVDAFDGRHTAMTDNHKLSKLMQEVVSTKTNTGDFVPTATIEYLCDKYERCDIDEKKEFLLILARDLHMDVQHAQQSMQFLQENLALVEHSQNGTVDWDHPQIERFLRSFRGLRQSLEPLYETFFQQILSQRAHGMLFLIQMRADILQLIRKRTATATELSSLRALDSSLKTLLAFWFSVGFLTLERVTYEHSSGQLLEKIIRYEAVHPVGTIIELKRRLGRNRRCFAFFHPSIPDEPLVFVHVALVKEMAGSMQYIRDETEQMNEESQAAAAIFYSISSTQKGLQGIDLGNFLIKEVAKALRSEHPQLEVFSTLSPIPQFVPWLKSQCHTVRDDQEMVAEEDLRILKEALAMSKKHAMLTSTSTPLEVVLCALEIDQWYEDSLLNDALRSILMKLAARYIYLEKKRAKALCPVANFHIRNGAIFERLNWLADLSSKGLAQSAGLMVNYKYDLANVEANNEKYLLQNVIHLGQQPKHLINEMSEKSRASGIP